MNVSETVHTKPEWVYNKAECITNISDWIIWLADLIQQSVWLLNGTQVYR